MFQRCASLWGRKNRYHPAPPSWPAEMSGWSQRKRDNQLYVFSPYKCVSLFLRQQRIRCNRVTFGDNKMFCHPRPVAQPWTGAIVRVSVRVWEVMAHVLYMAVSAGVHRHLLALPHLWCFPLMYAYVCVRQEAQARPCLCADIISGDSRPPSNAPMVLMCVSCWQLRQRDYRDCGEGTRKEQLIMPVNSWAFLHVQGHKASLSLSPCYMTRAMRQRDSEREGMWGRQREREEEVG